MKEILIPDEYTPDYTISKEEEQERYKMHSKKSDKAFKELDKMIDESIENRKDFRLPIRN